MTSRNASLVAVRVPLDPGPVIDPFLLAGSAGTLFRHEGLTLVGLGTATTMRLDHGLEDGEHLVRAVECVASIPCTDRMGAAGASSPEAAATPAPVLAFAALPFDRGSAGTLVVPELLYGATSDGREWLTVVGSDPRNLPASSRGLRSWLRHVVTGAPGEERAAPSIEWVVPRTTDTAFTLAIEEARSLITGGNLAKVVLARQVDVGVAGPLDIPEVLRRWSAREPACTIFSVPTGDGQFIGASPELLIERRGRRIRSRPLAGTTGRSPDGSRVDAETESRRAGQPTDDAGLLDSEKDTAEHRYVVDAIEQALRPLCHELDAPSEPRLVRLHTITHLGTELVGTLEPGSGGSVPDVLALLAHLHPTPAVGGVPRAAALALIDRLEPEPRGTYAGPVGYVDAAGDGRWVIGIRAATVRDEHLTLVAGVGIVAESDPATELAETELKLTAVFDVLAPGVPFPGVALHPTRSRSA